MNIKPENKALTDSQKRITGIIAFSAFILFCGLVGWFIGRPMIAFVSEPEKFRIWVDSHGIWGKIAFIIMVSFQVVIALVPGEPLEIGAGYAFGAIEGTFLCVAGITLGSMAVFYLVRKFGVKLVEVFFAVEKINSLKFLKAGKKRDLIVFLIFFLPGTPKDLITYFTGLTDIKAANFLLLASFARLPSVVTSTIGGSALGEQNYKSAIVVFVITLVISVFGWFIYSMLQKRKDKKHKGD